MIGWGVVLRVVVAAVVTTSAFFTGTDRETATVRVTRNDFRAGVAGPWRFRRGAASSGALVRRKDTSATASALGIRETDNLFICTRGSARGTRGRARAAVNSPAGATGLRSI